MFALQCSDLPTVHRSDRPGVLCGRLLQSEPAPVSGAKWGRLEKSLTADPAETRDVDYVLSDRARERRRSMVARVARSKGEAQAISDELEDALLPFERAEAIWALTCELGSMRGLDASEFRLDRSLARLERRRR